MTGRRPPVAFIFTVTVTGILSNTLLSPLLPDVLAEFDQPDSRAGLLVAVGSLPGIVVAPVIGILADRFGRRSVLLPCLFVFGTSGLVAAAAPTFEVLLVARLVQGLGSAGMINLAVVLIGDHWEGIGRTRLLGRNAAVLTVGLAIVPLLSGIVGELTSWRVSLGIYGVAVVTGLIGLRVLDDTRPLAAPSIGAQLRGAGRVIRQPVLLAAMTSGFLLFMAVFGLFLATLPIHLEEEFGLGAAARGLVIAVPAAVASVAAFNLDRLRGAAPLRTLLVGSAALFLVAFPLIGLAATLPLLLVGTAIYGAGEGVFLPVIQDVATSASPDEHRGAVVALWVGAARAGQSLGPLLVAALSGVADTGELFVLGGGLAAVVLAIQLFGPIDEEAVAESARMK